MILSGIIIGLIVLVFLIIVHELGHAIVAKRNGVVVEEFGIGFPPRAWSKKLRNGVLFTLNWLPLGGFVRLKGEHDAARGKGTYGAATFWQKTKILLAGVAMNWIVAAILLTILSLVGLPKIVQNQFIVPVDARVETSKVTLTKIMPGSAAEEAGFEKGDIITSVNNEQIVSVNAFKDEVQKLPGSYITVSFERDGVPAVKRLTLGNEASKGVFGAGLAQNETIHATWSAPIVGIVTTGQLSWETLSGLGGLIGKLATGTVQQFSPSEEVRDKAHQNIQDVSNSVAGPVGILGVIFPSAQEQGVKQVILLTAIVSLTLAVMNILPIPALDGGRWWTLVIFRVLKKKLTREREEAIQATGFLILMGLIILITASDVAKLW